MLKFEENLASRVGGALQPMLGIQVTVMAANGLLATLYADDESTVLANPMTTDTNGYFGFKAANGEYTLTFAGAQIATTARKIELYDADDDPPLTLAQAALPTAASRLGFQAPGDGSTGRTVENKLEETVSVKDYALVNGGSVDDPLEYATAARGDLMFPSGSYTITACVPPSQNKNLRAVPGLTHITTTPGNSANLLNFYNADNLRVSGLSIHQAKTALDHNGHGIVLRDANNCVVEDVLVDGIGGIGTGLIQYNTNGAKTERIVYRNIDAIGSRDIAGNTNGAVIVDAHWSRMSGIYAKGIGEFPAEFKNDCRYGLLSDVQIRDSRTGLYHGQTSGEHPSYIASSNVIIKGADFGIFTGVGNDNIYSNILYDTTGTTYAVPEAVRFLGSKSSLWSLHTTGDADRTIGVRHHTGAVNNYAKIAAHHSNANVVTIASGATRNVTEIAHPGTRNTIIGSPVSNANPASEMSGGTANPVYCHATGQYLGSLSNTWEWRLKTPPTVSNLFSTDTWRFSNSDQNGQLTLIGSDGYSHGLAVVTPSGRKTFNYTDTGDFWQIVGKTMTYRATATAFQALTDGAASLGAAAFRWSVVYASSGAINTSDERAKCSIQDLDAAAIRAARRIPFRQFKFSDAVLAKGDGARWHFGVIAQQVKQAFEDEGVDPFAYGVLCYDEWPEQAEVRDEATGEVLEAYRPIGNRFGVRYDELLCLKLAAMEAA